MVATFVLVPERRRDPTRVVFFVAGLVLPPGALLVLRANCQQILADPG